MKVEKKHNKYYVNDLDLEEVMANRKYVVRFLNTEIGTLSNMIQDTTYGDKTIREMKIRLKTLKDIQSKMTLRK